MSRLTATIHGRVQGVGFRWFVIRHATGLGLTGWVANDPAGSVSLVAEGTDHALDELLRLVSEGPAGAQVARVDSQRSAASGSYRRFDVRAAGHGGD